MAEGAHIVVIGLGYVGLPLAVALAHKFDVTGYDINLERINELKRGKRPHSRGERRRARRLVAAAYRRTTATAPQPMFTSSPSRHRSTAAIARTSPRC